MTVAAAPSAAAAPKQEAPSPPSPPKFKFGLLSDVQYADQDDGASFAGTPRYYRHALQQLDKAIDAMRAADVSLAIHLGGELVSHDWQHD